MLGLPEEEIELRLGDQHRVRAPANLETRPVPDNPEVAESVGDLVLVPEVVLRVLDLLDHELMRVTDKGDLVYDDTNDMAALLIGGEPKTHDRSDPCGST